MKLYKNHSKIFIAVFSLTLTTSLIGCASPQAQTTNSNSQTESQTSENTTTESQTLDAPTTEVQESPTTEKSQETSDSADTKLDNFISKMETNYQKLKKFAKSEEVTEAYKETKEETKNNFREFINFIFNDGEIDGVTYKELTSKGKAKVKNVLSKFDDDIEKYIPDYKERLKNWVEQKAANAVDYLDEFKDEVKQKQLTK